MVEEVKSIKASHDSTKAEARRVEVEILRAAWTRAGSSYADAGEPFRSIMSVEDVGKEVGWP